MRRVSVLIGGIVSLGLVFIAGRIAKCDDSNGQPPTSQPAVQLDPVGDAENAKIETRLGHNLPRVEMSNVSLADAIDFLRDVTALNLYVDWKTLGLAGVTEKSLVSIDGHDISVRNALTQFLAGTGSSALEFHVVDGIVYVSTKLDFEDRKKRIGPYLRMISDVAGTAPMLDKHLPKVELNNVSFADAVDFLRDVTGMSIWVDWKQVESVGIAKSSPISLQLQNVRTSAVLDLLLDQTGAANVGYVAVKAERKGHDRAQNPITVKTAAITISTIDDLVAKGKAAATQP